MVRKKKIFVVLGGHQFFVELHSFSFTMAQTQLGWANLNGLSAIECEGSETTGFKMKKYFIKETI